MNNSLTLGTEKKSYNKSKLFTFGDDTVITALH